MYRNSSDGTQVTLNQLLWYNYNVMDQFSETLLRAAFNLGNPYYSSSFVVITLRLRYELELMEDNVKV